ncbi:Transcriptional repressor SdpR [Anatilimnocola aggregata]|uniref:Transcriptional repressor SdpR n=1 Tax=Anatilimnocola aggregata TaxID=2528021 RepID=A0A517Y576_9BACT|nr:metalloregulator ArsR/SmtB family transcription factor [Anatilimnocola aggregata]QDU25397.1 Transcriptional repressor SdpR [Anatilimnocola aggregata]
MKDQAEFQACAERLKALADPERLRILQVLFGGPCTVGEIAERLSEDIVKVSHHLSILRRGKIVLPTRQGRFIQYSIHPEVIPAELPTTDVAKIDFGCCHLDLKLEPRET